MLEGEHYDKNIVYMPWKYMSYRVQTVNFDVEFKIAA